MRLKPQIHSLGELYGNEIFTARYENDEIKITFCNIGASIVSLETKDHAGNWADIVLGYDDWLSYANNTDNYMGSVVGRCANRIRNGQFSLNHMDYQLAVNNGSNHLHGGDAPFNTKVWQAEFACNQAIFSLRSPHGEGKYPGNVDVRVTYTIKDSSLHILYEGTTDQDTLMNLTNHTYFNLDGHKFGSLDHHELQIDAQCYIPIDETLIPTGEISFVADTPFDFRTTKNLLKDIECDDIQLARGNGYDHTFVMEGKAILSSSKSKRFVSVSSNMPGMQLYTGNYLNCCGKQNGMYGFRSGVALETQYLPDSINQPNFTPCILRSNEQYLHEATFTFGVLNTL